MTELEFIEFEKSLRDVYKEERRLKWEFVAAIISVPLIPIAVFLVLVAWNVIKHHH